MEMYIIVDKDLRDYDYQTGGLREPYVIGNTYECNGRFQYLSNGIIPRSVNLHYRQMYNSLLVR